MFFFSLKSEEDIEFIIKYLLHPGFVKFPTYKNNELNIEDMIYYWKGKWLLEFIPFKANDKSRIMGELFDHKILLKVGEVSEKLLTAMIKNDNDLFDDITKSAGKEIYNSLSVDINNYPYAIISQWYILLMINPPDEKISFGKLIVKEMILQSENKKIKKIKDYSRDMIIIYSNLIQSFSRSDLSQKNIRRVSRSLKIQIIMFKYFIKEINKYRLR